MSMFLIVIIVLVLVAFYFIGVYNGFIRGKNKIDEAWSSINVQLKRRFDLIPNLVETVKGYTGHEKGIFEKIAEARNAAMAAPAGDVTAQGKANTMLSQALSGLRVIVENYPNLQANTNFQQLQSNLSEIENDIQMARRYYNATVRDYNTKCEAFPSVVVANMFNFEKRDFFELDSPEEAKNVQVKF